MIGEITGSGSDVLSVALSLSDAMAPDKGFACTLCTFQIELKSNQTVRKQKATMAERDAPKREPNYPTIFRAASLPTGKISERKTFVELKVRTFIVDNILTGIVIPVTLDIDAPMNTLSLEIVALEKQISNGVLLVIKGLFNPMFEGYCHFIGATLIRVMPTENGVHCVSIPQFVAQVPPAESNFRGKGKITCGKVMEPNANDEGYIALTLEE